ncbi:replication initiator protein WhiP, partial [Sulfolobus sp. E5]
MTGDYEDNDMEEVIQQLTNDEKFNGSPRSKLVEAVIILLYARPLR